MGGFFKFEGGGMERTGLTRSVYRLAMAGEEAGFSLDDMIQLLNAGLTVLALLNLIEWRLGQAESGAPSATRWLM
jgi:hypothetical protein